MPSKTLSRRKLMSRGGAAAAAGIGAASILHWPANAAEFAYKLGSSSPMEHPAMARSAEAVAKIKEQTNGRLDITIYPNSVLGGDTAMIAQVICRYPWSYAFGKQCSPICSAAPRIISPSSPSTARQTWS